MASGRRLGDPLRADSPLIVPGMLRPDGEELAVNVAQGVQLWDLRPATQFAAACRIAGRELTAQEWTAYLPWVGDPEPVRADVLDARD